MVETNQNENSPKKPEKWEWLPFGEGVKLGLIRGAFLYIVWIILVFLVNHFLAATEWFRTLAAYLLGMGNIASLLSLRGSVVVAASVAVLLPMLWLAGHIRIKSVEDFLAKIWGKIFRKKKESKFLFCIKLKDKNFFGGYPIGFVTQVVWIGEKKYYHTWWPGILHLTLLFVPAEDVEMCNIPRKEVLKLYMSAGAL